jgi:hypothetical protein
MRGQSMSFDAIAATFLFVLIAVFGAVYAYNFFSADLSVTLTNEANALGDRIIKDLGTTPDGTDQIRIDERRLITLINQAQTAGYIWLRNELGGELGLRSDFCVFFEDENGNITTVIIDDGVIQARLAYFGSPEVLFNTTGGSGVLPCG